MLIDNRTIYVSDCMKLMERMDAGQIDLIVLDPPWNTGKHMQMESSDDNSSQRYHEFISVVFQHCYRLLAETGCMYVHAPSLDEDNYEFLLEQIFGRSSEFEIIYKRRSLMSNLDQTRKPRIDNDRVIVFSKSDEFTYNPIYQPLDPEMYPHEDSRGLFRKVALWSRSAAHQSRRFVWKGVTPPLGMEWVCTKEKLDQLEHDGKIYWETNSGNPFRKQYMDEVSPAQLGMVWDDIRIEANERTRHAGQMPLTLAERIIQIGSNAGDLVFDPFFGSGTTFVAAEKLGRRWAGVDSLDDACEITVERLTSVGLLSDGQVTVHPSSALDQIPVISSTVRKLSSSVSELESIANRNTGSIGLAPIVTTFHMAQDLRLNPTSQLDAFFKFSEFIAAFNAVVLLSCIPEDVYREHRNEIWTGDKTSYGKISFGQWVGLNARLSKIMRKRMRSNDNEAVPNAPQFLKGISDKKLSALLDPIPKLRNDTVGHGGIIQEAVAAKVIRDLEPRVQQLYDYMMETYSDFELIFPMTMAKKNKMYEIQIKVLTGLTNVYKTDVITTPHDMDTDVLHLYNRSNDVRIALLPELVKLIQCESCGNWSIFMYNKIVKNEAEYMSYQAEIHSHIQDVEGILVDMMGKS